MITSAFALLSVLAAVVGKIYPFAATGVLFEAGETPYRAEDTFALDAATGRGKFRGVHAGAFAKPERSSFNPVFPVIAKGVATGAYARDVGGLPGRIQQVNNISPGAYTRPGSGPYTGVFEEDEGLISPGADFASSTGIEDEPYTDNGFPSMNVANAANEELSVLFPGSGVDSSVGIDTGRGLGISNAPQAPARKLSFTRGNALQRGNEFDRGFLGGGDIVPSGIDTGRGRRVLGGTSPSAIVGIATGIQSGRGLGRNTLSSKFHNGRRKSAVAGTLSQSDRGSAVAVQTAEGLSATYAGIRQT